MNMKPFYILLFTMFAVCGLAQAQTKVTFTAGVESSGADGTGAQSMTKDGVTVAISGGTLTRDDNYRIYRTQTITISSEAGAIVSVQFTCTESDAKQYGPGCLTTKEGYSYAGKVGTWRGNATEVVFTASSNQVRVTEIVVTLGNMAPNYVAKPAIFPASGTYYSAQEVTITADEGATIYYTTDGSEPTAYSKAYTAPFTVIETTAIKAIAVTGKNKSEVMTSVITIQQITTKTIAEVIAAGNVDQTTTAGTVFAVYDMGFVLGDNTGLIFVYGENTLNVGAQIIITGKVSLYGGCYQISNATISEMSFTSVTYPTPREITGVGLDALVAAPAVTFVKMNGTLNSTGIYKNMSVEGTTVVCNIFTSDVVFGNAKVGDEIVLTGYFIYQSGSGKYGNIIATKVKKQGEDENNQGFHLTYVVDGKVYKSYDLQYAAPINPEAAPTKEGYTFSGWSEIPTTMPAKDFVVWGTFTPNNYCLTYEVDGETYKTVQIQYGSTITAEAAPTKEGYTFSGWSNVPVTMPAKDVVVIGTFTPNNYCLTYKVDGETYKTMHIQYGSTITPEEAPTKEGYTFSGWSNVPTTMPASDLVIIGTFTPNNYCLTYKVDGETYKTVHIQYGSTITPEAAPKKEGYTFSGWQGLPVTILADDIVVTGTFIKATMRDGDRIKSTNADGVTIYYVFVNNGTELNVTFAGNSYSYIDNEYTGNIVIPNLVIYGDMDYPVTGIGENAFRLCSRLTAITIPASVTSISTFAFQGCTSIRSVIIEDGTETLSFSTSSKDTPFRDCPIESLYMGRNINFSSGYSPFKGNEKLTSLTIGNNVTSIPPSTFYNCSGITSLSLPDNVTSIASSTFSGCSGLTSLTLPNSVTSIGESAFSGCSGLKTLTIGSNLQSIGSSAFKGCTGLATLTIPNNVQSIGSSAFYNCSSLTSVVIEEGTEILSFQSSNNYTAFTGCPLEKLYLGRNISYPYGSYSNDSPFKEKRELTSLTICKNVTKIENDAFYGCNKLTVVSMPDNIMSMGKNAFASSTKLYVNKGSKTLLTFWNTANNSYQTKYVPIDKSTDKEILPPSFKIDPITQTTATIKIENWCDGYNYLYNGEVTSTKIFSYKNLKPESTRKLTLMISKDDVHYETKGSFTTKGLMPRIEEWASTPSSITAKGAYTEEDAKVVGHSIMIGNTEAVEGNECFASGLNAGSSYTVKYSIVVDYGGEETATYTGTKQISTQGIKFSMAPPKVVSEGNVIVSASTNLVEDETNVGFEWRCTDWTDEFPSNTATAYLYDGMIEGYIKNMNTNKLWKCRPYYLSDSGIYHYGDWIGIDPTNTSYFEPTVHTYSKVTIKGNTALVRGYALSGTEEVKVQGFKYWRTSGKGNRQRRAVAVPIDAMTVEVNGLQIMTTTLQGLDYDSEYCCVAFVTTANGNTYYGEEQIFTTAEAPSGIESIETGNPISDIGGEAIRYNINGQQIVNSQKGVNIIRYSNGLVKKVLVK